MSIKRLSFITVLLASFGCHSAIGKEKVLNIQHWETTNGVKVYFVSSLQNPIVDVKILFAAGASRDGDKAGIASLTNNMLDEGTKSLSSDAIAEKLENVGAKFSSNTGRDFAELSFRSLSDDKYLNPTVQVFNQILTQPNFPQKALSRVREQTLAELQSEQQEPGTIANQAFFKALYGNTPYANNVMGEASSVKKLTQQDLVKFYQQYYVASNAVLVMVGNLTTDQAKQLSDKVTSHLPVGKEAIALQKGVPLTSAVMKHVVFPSEQTHVLIGQVGIDKKSPDYFPATVGNFVLGGDALTSRLFDVVREKKGLAYQVASAFTAMKQPGPFYIVMQTRKSEADHAIDLTKATLSAFLQSGPTEEELNLAKNYIVQSFPLKLASNSGILNLLSEIAAYQLPLDYLDTYCDNVKAVTIAQVKDSFQKLINPNHLVTITVGNLAS
jgi:zinc protease